MCLRPGFEDNLKKKNSKQKFEKESFFVVSKYMDNFSLLLLIFTFDIFSGFLAPKRRKPKKLRG